MRVVLNGRFGSGFRVVDWCPALGPPRRLSPSGLPQRFTPAAAVSQVEKPSAPSSIANDDWEAGYDAPLVQAASTRQVQATGRVILESEDELKSTWEHRLWVGTTIMLLGGTFTSGLLQINSFADSLTALGATVGAYYLSDLGTAFYHWGVDNYGDAATPVLGGQIAAFQGHHQRPWTITEREFCNNVHKVFAPAAPIAGLLLAVSPIAPPTWSIWSSTFLFLVCMSQQFHAWSHMKRSELHPAIVAAQNSGILISRKAHGAHHKAPFDGNYSIVSGWWNPILDGDAGKGSVFKMLEHWIYDTWGVEPRCWSDPKEDWMEERRPAE